MKKLLLALGTIATVAAPVVTVISCGSTNNSTNDKMAATRNKYRSMIFNYGKDADSKIALLALVMTLDSKEKVENFLDYPDMKDVIKEKELEESGGLSKAQVVLFIKNEISKSSGEYIIKDNTIDAAGNKLTNHGEGHTIVIPGALNIGDTAKYRTINPLTGSPKDMVIYQIEKVDKTKNPIEVTFKAGGIVDFKEINEEITYKVTRTTDGIILDNHNTGKNYFSNDDAKSLSVEKIRKFLEDDSDIKVKINISDEDLQDAWDIALRTINA